MTGTTGKTRIADKDAARRKAREDKDRMAESATAAAESFVDRENRAEMSDEEKLQQRIDDLMAQELGRGPNETA